MNEQIFGDLHTEISADYDCIIQIVFKDVQDFINVKDDPHYKQAVLPDHGHFADTKRTKMVTGWFETHIPDMEAAKPGLESDSINGKA